MKELYFKVDGKEYKICTLLAGHHKDLWFGKMTKTKSMHKKAEHINRLDRLKQSDIDFSIEQFKEFISKNSISTWVASDTYLFKIV